MFYIFSITFSGCRLSHIYAITEINTESREPNGDASPMGKSDAVKNFDAMYATGILTARIEMQLFINGMLDRPHAQKYPQKLKFIPANTQSHT